MPAPDTIKNLVQCFEEHLASYRSGKDNETQLSWLFLRKSNIAQRDDFPKVVLKETRSLPIRPSTSPTPLTKRGTTRWCR